MVTNPRAARGLKGALASIDADSGQLRIITFQYNPSTVRRQLRPLTLGGEAGDRSQAVRLIGPPQENISLEIELDAADGLEAGDATVLRSGLNPQIAAFELLSFPPSQRVALDRTLLSVGSIEISPSLAPRLLFVWGATRVQPVQIVNYTIAEEEFDANLNPIRVTIALELRVITYTDVAAANPDNQQYFAYQQALETLAGFAYGSDRTPTGANW